MRRIAPLIAFFALAYMFTWANWLPQALNARGVETIRLPEFVVLLAGYGPALAALIVVLLMSGRRGLRELLGRLVRWRVGVQWYAVALLLPVGVTLAALGINALFGGALPDRALNAFPFGPPETPLWQQAALLFLIFTLGFDGLGEELGWRGFALPHMLQNGASPVVASVILGLLWAGWHLPYAFTPGSALAGIPLPLFFVNLVAVAMIYTWLFNHTQGSVLIAILFHAAGNTISNLLPILPPAAPDLHLYFITVALHWIIALVILVATGATLAPRKPPFQTTANGPTPRSVTDVGTS